MGQVGNVIIENKEIENDRLELTDKNSVYFLGPNLTLRGCTVVLKVAARNLLINQASLIDCTIEVKQELKNHQQWVFASLIGCRFKGRMTGCDFGHWPTYYTKDWEKGFIEDCDFTEARLDGCRFMGCEPDTLRYPRWPCFTLVNPIIRAAELCKAEWPGIYGPVVVKHLHAQPPTTRALTDYAPAVAKQCDTTPEALKAVIEKFDCFVY